MANNTGLNNAGPGNARQRNQQAMQNAAGQAGQAADFEFGTELGGTTGAAGATGAAGTLASGAAHARQRNQQAMQNAASKAGRIGR